MIITKTPLRISFVGGGTDLPAFYRKELGAVVSSTINKNVYIIIHDYFDDRILLKYSQTELVNSVDEIKMPVFKEAFKLYGIEKKIDVTVVQDIPKEGGSGLGGSTAFSIGLLNALGHYTGKVKNQTALAEEATRLEIEILKNPIGKQDQYASAIGGLNLIQFNPDESVSFKPLYLKSETKKRLKDNLIMFYTGITRNANEILSEQQKNLTNEQKFGIQKKMKDYALEMYDRLIKNDITYFGKMLHENWLLKKELAAGISNPKINEWYEKAINAGAEGGKILGAGGGGFFLFYCDKEKQENLKKSLGLQEFKFKFEHEGTKVILYEED